DQDRHFSMSSKRLRKAGGRRAIDSRRSCPGSISFPRLVWPMAAKVYALPPWRFKMLRSTKTAVGLIMVLSTLHIEARAQWGFGGWGWDGWGVGPPESAALHGAAEFALGAGMYNLNTAQAMAIDANTAMRFNDYVAQITREEARIYSERVNARIARNRELY